jgi:hypothetical protein
MLLRPFRCSSGKRERTTHDGWLMPSRETTSAQGVAEADLCGYRPSRRLTVNIDVRHVNRSCALTVRGVRDAARRSSCRCRRMNRCRHRDSRNSCSRRHNSRRVENRSPVRCGSGVALGVAWVNAAAHGVSVEATAATKPGSTRQRYRRRSQANSGNSHNANTPFRNIAILLQRFSCRTTAKWPSFRRIAIGSARQSFNSARA